MRFQSLPMLAQQLIWLTAYYFMVYPGVAVCVYALSVVVGTPSDATWFAAVLVNLVTVLVIGSTVTFLYGGPNMVALLLAIITPYAVVISLKSNELYGLMMMLHSYQLIHMFRGEYPRSA